MNWGLSDILDNAMSGIYIMYDLRHEWEPKPHINWDSCKAEMKHESRYEWEIVSGIKQIYFIF